MAGPFRLAPQEVEGSIPTWAFGRQTKVLVDCEAEGNFEMTAGGSATEVNKLVSSSSGFCGVR